MQLKHPNICQFHQFGADAGSHFIVMEWVNGVPLGRLIRKARKTGGIGLPIAVRIAVDIAKALHYAHIANDEHGEPFNIIHRDVSPHNIMVGYNGAAKLLDFGIAKADHRAHKTQAGVVKGKFAYMAPEQCTAAPSDHRLDIFALGVCVFESLTGRSLYRRKTEAATMRAVIMDPVPSLKERLPDAPDDLERILQKALAKDANDRYESAEELAGELEAFGRSTNQFATQREVADFVKKVFPEEFNRGPRVDTVPFGASISVDMLHANPSAFDSQKSLVSAMPGAIRDLELDADQEGVDLGHLIDSPVVLPQAEPANNAEEPEPDLIQRPTEGPKLEVQTRAPKKPRQARPRSSAPKQGSRFGWKQLVALLVLLVIGGAVAYDQTDVVKDAVDRVSVIFEEKGPPEVAVDENPLLLEHGARILLASSPPGAKVFLDGIEQGVAPVALTGLMEGEYRVRVESPGFASWSTKVQVSQGETAGVTAKLLGKQGGAKPGAFGRVNLETTPPADAYLAGDLIGRTPLQTVYAPLGQVQFEFKLPNGRSVRRNVDVVSGSVARARFDLSKSR
jgi:serine/threonine protein kinase